MGADHRGEGRRVRRYPWAGLGNKTYGMRLGEVVTLSSGTGQGKSSICREWQYWLLQKGHHVGIIALEENIRHTGRSLMGLHLGFPPHKWNDRKPTEEELKEAFESTVGSGRCTLYDHWGSLESDYLLSRIRYMVRSMGCTHLFGSPVHRRIRTWRRRRAADDRQHDDKTPFLVEELQISSSSPAPTSPGRKIMKKADKSTISSTRLWFYCSTL